MMTFRAIASGSTWINFTSVALADFNGYVIPCTSKNTRVIIAPTVVTSTVRIYPGALNLASKGKWIYAYIELPEGYNVSNINASSILMNNTFPVPSLAPVSISNYDGNQSLMVGFNRTSVIDYLVSKGITYANVTLTLTGKLYKGTSFVGSDIIRVSALVGDVNCDGQVDILDIVQAANCYGSKEGEPNWNANANFAPPWNTIDILDLVTIIGHYGQEDLH
jgi:hypothetical protein